MDRETQICFKILVNLEAMHEAASISRNRLSKTWREYIDEFQHPDTEVILGFLWVCNPETRERILRLEPESSGFTNGPAHEPLRARMERLELQHELLRERIKSSLMVHDAAAGAAFKARQQNIAQNPRKESTSDLQFALRRAYYRQGLDADPVDIKEAVNAYVPDDMKEGAFRQQTSRARRFVKKHPDYRIKYLALR